eukprot:gene2863-4706_t
MSNIVVIDNGSYSIKFGSTYDATPYEIETLVAFERGNLKVSSESYYIGSSEIEKERKDKIISQRYPIQNGCIMDWDQIESLWNYCLKTLNSKDDLSILMTLHAMTPKDHRESITEMMFELFEIEQFYIEIPGALSFFNEFKNQNEDGVIIDSGSGVTNIIPILNGKVDLNRVHNCKVTGRIISEYLNKLILKKGYNLNCKEEYKIIEKIKKEYSYLSFNFDEELIKNKNKQEIKKFEIEETKEIILLDEEIFICNEILFDPTLFGIQNGNGIHQEIFEMLNFYEEENYEKLTNNLLLSGGNTKIPGLLNRFDKELKDYSKLNGKKFNTKPKILKQNSTWNCF